MSRLLRALVNSLIAYAKRTPYFHLPGYMERYWLLKPRWWTLGCSIRIHHILRSDEDRALHDHPWPFVTLILRGGYYEERPVFSEYPVWALHEPTGTTWHGAGSVLVRAARSRHRLRLARYSTTWTLFFMGPWRQQWGFYTSEGKVHWSKYLPDESATYQAEQLALHRGAE
jgi:hypothetical protein